MDVAEMTDNELLEMLTGSKAAAKAMGEGMYTFLPAMMDVKEAMVKYGVTKRNAEKVLAGLELGKRLVQHDRVQRLTIRCPEDGAMLMMPRLRYANHEYFYVVTLNSKGKVMDITKVSEGSLNASVVHPREAIAPVILNHGAAWLAFHNHPSGDPDPSREDRELTRSLAEAGKLMGISLVDHIVIGDGVYYSFKEHGLL